jgi:arylsulfatase A-like enzyme
LGRRRGEDTAIITLTDARRASYVVLRMSRDPLDIRALRKRYALILSALFIVWVVLAIGIVPPLIRIAYAGEAPAFFNRIISGQAAHPLTKYLSMWKRVAWPVTAGLVGFALAGFFALPYVARIAPRIAPRIRSLLAAWLPRVTMGDVLVFGTWIGMVAGIAEAAWAVWRRKVKHFPTGFYVRGEVFWMTPLAAVVTFVVLGLVLFAVDRALRGRGTLLGLGPPLFAGLAVISLMRALGIGVGPVPIVVLALGAATVVARVLMARPTLVRRVLRPVTAGLVACLIVLAVALPVWRRVSLARTMAAVPEAKADAPNVLIVIWDAVRAMNMSLHGHARETTPVLERFAQAGTVFDRAFATAPWSLPSHASMFTGRYPTEMTAARQAPLDDTFPTLAEVLARNGYATGGFTANIYYGSSSFGIARGFAWYVDVAPIRPGVIASTWWLSRRTQELLRRATVRHAPGPLRPRAVDVNSALLRWIDRRGQRPFFAVINQFEAHDPYLPPEPFNLAFSEVQPRFWLGGGNYSADLLQELTTAYDSSIRYLDYELDRLLEALRERGLLDNTLVIVTSDHGEHFGEHLPNLVRHARSLYTTVLHVPLVVVAPSRVPAGVRRQETVSIRDIPATVMDVLGLSAESPFPGTSLLRYATDSVTPEEVAEPRLAAGEKSGLEGLHPSWPIFAGDMFALLAGDLHYIVDGNGREELYDLSTDRWGLHDLAGTPEAAPHLARFRAALDSMVEPDEDGVRRAFIRHAGGRPASNP